jgi:hypothetical protein
MYALDGSLFKIIHETFEFFPGRCNQSGIARTRSNFKDLTAYFENSKRSPRGHQIKWDARIADFNVDGCHRSK